MILLKPFFRLNAMCFVFLVVSACSGNNKNDVRDSLAQKANPQSAEIELGLAGGKVISKDDGSASNPLGYSVLFGYTNKNFDATAAAPCTGTLIHKRVVLTAAHCKVKEGDSVISEAGGKISEYKVKKVTNHNGYQDSNDLKYASADFTLVLLDRESNGRPIPLTSKPPTSGQLATVSGYGARQFTPSEIALYKRENNGETPTGYYNDVNLRSGTMKVNDVKESGVKELAGTATISLSRGNAMTCKGDSGGPLVLNGQLAGVLHGGGLKSRAGEATCNEKYYKDGYSAFASVAHQRSWIEKAMNELLNPKKDEPRILDGKDCLNAIKDPIVKYEPWTACKYEGMVYRDGRGWGGWTSYGRPAFFVESIEYGRKYLYYKICQTAKDACGYPNQENFYGRDGKILTTKIYASDGKLVYSAL